MGTSCKCLCTLWIKNWKEDSNFIWNYIYLNDEKTLLNDALTMVFYEDLKDHCTMLKKEGFSCRNNFIHIVHWFALVLIHACFLVSSPFFLSFLWDLCEKKTCALCLCFSFRPGGSHGDNWDLAQLNFPEKFCPVLC